MKAATPLPGGLYPIIRRARRPLIIQDDDAPSAPAPSPQLPGNQPESVGDGGVTATEPKAAAESKGQRLEKRKN